MDAPKSRRKSVEFPSEITNTGQRFYINIPKKYIKLKQLDPKKIVWVQLTQSDDDEEFKEIHD